MKTIEEQVRKILVEQVCVAPPSQPITRASRLEEDLGMDSLDCVEVQLCLEEKFGTEISEEVAEKWKTVGDIVSFVEQAPRGQRASRDASSPLDSADPDDVCEHCGEPLGACSCDWVNPNNCEFGDQ